jgi:hypothetical protein
MSLLQVSHDTTPHNVVVRDVHTRVATGGTACPVTRCRPFLSRDTQEWEWYYVLRKARRLRDAAQTLALSKAISSEGMSKTQRPPYLASRKEGRGALPEV